MASNPITLTSTTNTPRPSHHLQRWIGRLTLTVISLIGLAAFLAPFWSSTIVQSSGEQTRGTDSPVIIAVVTVACLVVAFANLGPALSSKSVALLGVLIGINIVLRIVDLSFLPPGEFTPIFVLVILVGYVFGSQMGFLMGALTMLGSAFFTGGIGPWLPFQMFTAGWIGMTAGWIPSRPDTNIVKAGEIVKLAIFGFAWGFLYGAIINLYFWPFLAAGSAAETSSTWTPGISLSETLARYGAFYAITSVGPDLSRAAGNAILLLTLGPSLLRVFRRFRARFTYSAVEQIKPNT